MPLRKEGLRPQPDGQEFDRGNWRPVTPIRWLRPQIASTQGQDREGWETVMPIDPRLNAMVGAPSDFATTHWYSPADFIHTPHGPMSPGSQAASQVTTVRGFTLPSPGSAVPQSTFPTTFAYQLGASSAVPETRPPSPSFLTNTAFTPVNSCLQDWVGQMQQPNPHQQAQAQLVNQQMQQRNAALEHQMAQRRARKPVDLNLPDGLEDICIGDGVQQYNALRAAEKRLDALMTRKRLEIQDSLSRNVKRTKQVRIWISNTVSGQPWQSKGDQKDLNFQNSPEPTYRVRTHGRLIEYKEDDLLYSSGEEDDDDDEDQVMQDGDKPKEEKRKPKTVIEPSHEFTHFFKSVDIDFDCDHVAGDPNYTASWKKSEHPDPEGFDTLYFARKSDRNININMCFTRDEQPERFKLSPVLASAIDTEEADRAEVVMAIWEYAKYFGLQDDDERRTIRCDATLKEIFGTDTIFFPQVAERIIPHLLPLPPIKLPYTIRVDEEFHKNPEPTIYDVEVLVDDPLRALYLKFIQNPKHQEQQRQIQKINDQLAVLVQELHHHKARHAFFSAMAKDPLGTMQKWVASQKKDLAIIMGEADKADVAGMEYAKGGEDSVWNSEAVKEAVRYRLAREDASRH